MASEPRFAVAAVFLTAALTASADPLPADRRIDWSTAGVPGGIPERTTLCATLSPGATAAAINSAIAACNGGVVKLNPGTYTVTGLQVHRDNVTLRGSGAGLTVLRGCNIVRLGSGGVVNLGTAITAGGARGSRTFTVATATGLSVGMMIELDRDNDPQLVVSTVGGSRHLRQVNVVTALSGTAVTVRNPLVWDFGTGNGRVKFTFLNTRNSGVEDLTLDHSGTSGCTNFALEYCDGCWVKGIESKLPAGYHFTILGTVNGELRDSFVHDAQTFGANNGGLAFYGSPMYGSNSSWKIENNIFDKTFPAIELQNASSGFFCGYNFSYGSAATATNAPATWTWADNHGPHDMMNLWEGNVGELFGSDGYFGGSSHATLFRNHITGLNRNSGNTDDPIRLNRLTWFYNIIGNVLGSTPLNAGKYVQAANNCAGGPAIYRLGYPNIGNCSLTDVTGNAVPGGLTYPDAKVASTLLRWGNYDTFNQATRFEAAEIPTGVAVPADQVLPASYYYSARPAWLSAAVPWPPIGPDVTSGNGFGDTSGHVHKIPAERCWDSAHLGDGGVFTAATCYPPDAGGGTGGGSAGGGGSGGGGGSAGGSSGGGVGGSGGGSAGGAAGGGSAGGNPGAGGGGGATPQAGCGCSHGAWPVGLLWVFGAALFGRRRRANRG